MSRWRRQLNRRHRRERARGAYHAAVARMLFADLDVGIEASLRQMLEPPPQFRYPALAAYLREQNASHPIDWAPYQQSVAADLERKR